MVGETHYYVKTYERADGISKPGTGSQEHSGGLMVYSNSELGVRNMRAG